MKRNISKALVACAALLCARPAPAQSYSTEWTTIDGGGGTSSGPGFTLSGTIGQPDAGTMSGGGFALTGGFWSLYDTTQPAPPWRLTIHRVGANAVISWPVAVTAFTLEYTTQLGSGTWTTESGFVVDTATEHTVTVPASLAHRFYRLRK